MSARTVFIAEGENHVREALSLLIENLDKFILIGEARNAESLLAQAPQHLPDLLLLDWDLPGIHHQRLIAALHQHCPNSMIIVTSVRPEEQRLSAKYGVDAFLLKHLPPDQFVHALETAVDRKNHNKTNF